MAEEPNSGTFPLPTAKLTLTRRALLTYRRILDGIVTALIFVMVLALLGALGGLILDFIGAVGSFSGAVHDTRWSTA